MPVLKRIYDIVSGRAGTGTRGALQGRDVQADVTLEDGLFYVILKNTGQDPVSNVTVRFSPDVQTADGFGHLSALPVFSKLSLMVPGKEIRIFVDTAASFFTQNRNHKITLTVRYTDLEGKPRAWNYPHDFGAYKDFPQPVPPS